MRPCSVTKQVEIVPGKPADYAALARFHYRDGRLGPYAAIYTMRSPERPTGCDNATVGVIVYRMPTAGLQLRQTATGSLFAGLDRATRLTLVNRNIRCIARVIIEPRFRGLGLAARLVRETLGLLGVPIIEAMAVMGRINPFFEKAGMSAYRAPQPTRCILLTEALNLVGIERKDLLDTRLVQAKLDHLPGPRADFIKTQIERFLQSYGRRRQMPPGLQRTRYVLSKLTARPVYYIWFNPDLPLLTK